MNTNLLEPLTRWCEIDLDLLSHNIDETKNIILPDTKIMAVVKDNASGHSDIVIANDLWNRPVHVIVNDHLVEVIGNICMDQLIINVTSIPNVQEWDIVTLIGSSERYTVSLDDIAQMINTLDNEIANHINPRVPRVYISIMILLLDFHSFNICY